MKLTAIKVSIAAVGIVLNLLPMGKAFAYTFTKIGAPGTFGNDVRVFAINDQGTVAFLNSDKTIFTGSGGPLTTIDSEQYYINPVTGSDTRLSSLDINNSGTVVYTTNSRDYVSIQHALVTGNGGPLTLIYRIYNSTEVPPPFNLNCCFSNFTSAPAINNAGTVVISESSQYLIPPPLPPDVGKFSVGTSYRVFTISGGATTTIADTNGTNSTFSSVRGGDLNNGGTVAFSADLKAGGSGIFTSNGGAYTTIADTNGTNGSFSSLGNFAINNQGTVAFEANPKAGSSGIFTSNGGTTTKIADTNSPSNVPSINDEGTVAFLAGLTGGGEGLFTSSGGVINKVIATGDTLDGSTVTSLAFFNKGLNNSGQLVFESRLANGTEGIYRADPETVPEPNGAVEVGVAILGSWLLKTRMR